MLVAAFALGFFVMSAGPLGFQYAAELGAPSEESISQGLLLLVGQASGILFVEAMGSDAAIQPMLLGFTGLAAVCLALSATMRESPAFRPDARPPGDRTA